MKFKSLIILMPAMLLLGSCGPTQQSSSSSSSSTTTGSQSSTTSHSTSQGPVKNIVKAHTLSDTKPSDLNLNSKGQQVTESTWNSFKYHSDSKYSGYFNYTYTSILGYTNRTIQKFTKNGYYAESNYGKTYFEKTGGKCYSYASTSDGLLRSESYYDISGNCKTTLEHEIYVHMFDFENYEYDDYDGCYWYRTTQFGAAVKFQNGYLTYLHYAQGGTAIYDLEAVFDTKIEIPESYYLS